MSSYDEHLISMAGGDGDVLDQIQRRADRATRLGEWETTRANDVVIYDPNGFGAYMLVAHANHAEFIAHARTDVPALLTLVREQQARIERVRELHAQKFYDKWGRTSEVPTEYGGWCNICARFDGASCPTVAALEPTP